MLEVASIRRLFGGHGLVVVKQARRHAGLCECGGAVLCRYGSVGLDARYSFANPHIDEAWTFQRNNLSGDSQGIRGDIAECVTGSKTVKGSVDGLSLASIWTL